ncbi:hypothetical protein [Marinitoga aeolica]|uniref:Uncharacterized protein n=1 Tax=Marinitoga aeolica TaxID=2809031 RepID=A0ABY8PTR3_9BACT|nr:hypothetical protein [Marinitoga aeolica]WGS66012.1 hypothetical protein JRV97_05540 [Marinitoga aeolica]
MLFMFRSRIRFFLNIFSWIFLTISLTVLLFSYINFQNKKHMSKIAQIKRNENIMSEYNLKINSTKKANSKLYDFLNFLEQIKTKVIVQDIDYTPESLDATILIEVIDGMKIISPYQIKENGTLDLMYEEYKILELKK